MKYFFDTKVFSSLAKVFPDGMPKDMQIDEVQLLKNERESFQVAYFAHYGRKSGQPNLKRIEIVSDISDYIEVYRVGNIYSNFPIYEDNDHDCVKTTAGVFPDLLTPCGELPRTIYDSWQTFWFEIDPQNKVEAGVYDVTVRFVSEKDTVLGEETIKAEIIDDVLPEQELISTHWFHSDCLAVWYRTDVFSDEYWRIVENFVKTYVKYGQNLILTPLFTPPLDTEIGSERPTVQLVDVEKNGDEYKFSFANFEKWVDMCLRNGIKYFEMSHLFTQWGAAHAPKIMATVDGEYKRIFGWETDSAGEEYASFLRAFAPAIIAEIDKLGIREKCYFHVSDEPTKENIETYAPASKIVHELFGEFPIIDALSHFEFYEKGVVTLPIPITSSTDDFKGKVPQLWTYFCCGPYVDYANRFFALPSRRTRIIGLQMYKYDIKGFLHWGYNFYFSRLSKVQPINPFQVSDAIDEFPSGDAYVVYPGFDGTPQVSLRFKVFYDAYQDMRACKLLESYIGRDAVIELIEENLDGELKFSTNPSYENWLLEVRKKINENIKKFQKKC